MKVTKDNAVVGLKVVIDKDSGYIGQQKEAVYGVIVNSAAHFPAESDYPWVQVNWIAENGKAITCNSYRIGENGVFDLNVYQEESKDVMPEYVECVGGYGDCVKGTVYCTANDIEANSLTWQEILISCGNLGSYFIPSTKEAFDLQNQPKEDLVGRYLKTLVNNPVSIGMDIGEYLLVTSFNTDDAVYDVTRVRDNHAGFGIEVSDLLKFEVMPVGFNPESEVGENLVGRYIKALKDCPEGGSVKKDELGIITRINRINGINAYVDFPNHKGYYATFGSTSLYELMPIGFTPESEVKPQVKKLEVPYPKTSYKHFKEYYTKLPIVTSVKRSNIVPLKLEKQKSLINLPTI